MRMGLQKPFSGVQVMSTQSDSTTFTHLGGPTGASHFNMGLTQNQHQAQMVGGMFNTPSNGSGSGIIGNYVPSKFMPHQTGSPLQNQMKAPSGLSFSSSSSGLHQFSPMGPPSSLHNIQDMRVNPTSPTWAGQVPRTSTNSSSPMPQAGALLALNQIQRMQNNSIASRPSPLQLGQYMQGLQDLGSQFPMDRRIE